MKKTLVLMALVCCYTVAPISLAKNAQAKASSQSLDQIVAIVNDDVITTSELNHGISIAKMQISQGHLPMPPASALNKQVLDQLINKKLQLQVAKQVGVTASEGDLQNAVESVARQNNMTVAMLYQRLTQEGMAADDYQTEMRDQLTMQKLQQQEVVSKITITPDEVNNFMHSKIWQSNSANEYHLQDILIPLSDSPTSDEIAAARKHANTVISKLNQGQSFQALAEAESSEANALKGGDLGWRKLPEIPTAFAEHVAKMQTKEVAGPIQTANGFHILRLAGTRATATKQAAPDRKQVENLLLQQKFEEAVQNWVSKLRSQAFINLNPSAAA